MLGEFVHSQLSVKGAMDHRTKNKCLHRLNDWLKFGRPEDLRACPKPVQTAVSTLLNLQGSGMQAAGRVAIMIDPKHFGCLRFAMFAFVAFLEGLKQQGSEALNMPVVLTHISKAIPWQACTINFARARCASLAESSMCK